MDFEIKEFHVKTDAFTILCFFLQRPFRQIRFPKIDQLQEKKRWQSNHILFNTLTFNVIIFYIYSILMEMEYEIFQPIFTCYAAVCVVDKSVDFEQ